LSDISTNVMIKIQLFIILSYEDLTAAVVGHVQTTFVISISGDSISLSKWSIQATLRAFNFLNLVSWDLICYLYMTYYKPLSDLHTIV